MTSVDLVALGDLGLRPLPSPEAAGDFHELIRERYERRPRLLTSHRALTEWPEGFGSALPANAALDRLTHHCHVVVIRGQSYRRRSRRGEEPVTIGPSDNGPEPEKWLTPTRL